MDAETKSCVELRSEERSPGAGDTIHVPSRNAQRSKQSRLTTAIATASTCFKAACYKAAIDAVREMGKRGVGKSKQPTTKASSVRKSEIRKQSGVRQSDTKVGAQHGEESFC